MKNFTKKILSGFLALAMIFGMIIPSIVKAQGNTDVVIHKIKMDNLDGWPKKVNSDGTYLGADNSTKYDGSKIADISTYFGNNAEELDGVKFIYWEVTKELYEEMMADANSYKTKEQVKAKVQNVDAVTPKEGTTTEATANQNGVTVQLQNGTEDAPKYYWFVEDIGSNLGDGSTLSDAAAVPFGIALPIYKADGTSFGEGDDKALHIYPKNTITKPEIDKNFAQGTGNSQGAEYTKYSEEKEKISRTIGSNIPYHVKTKLPAKAKYKTLRWEDTMDKGLTFNKDVTVKITKVTGTVVESDEFSNPNEYTIVQNESGFVLEFTKAGLEKLIEKLDSSDYEIEFNYSATLNGEAVIDNPEENRIKFDYSNNPKEFKDPRENPTTPKEDGGKYKIEVQKTWANGADTTAPNNIEVTYFLYEKGQTQAGDKVVATHKVTNANFNHTFENLEQNKEYYVKELVKGYDPEYTADDGTVSIKNTKDNDNPESLIPTNPKVVTHGKKFVKTDNKDANGATPLLGAEFVVKNNADKYLALKDAAVVENDKTVYEEKQAAYLKAIEDYNKLEKDAQTEEEKQKIETAKAQRDIAFNKVRINYEWTTEETKALKIVSNTKGQFEVTGLEAGTYKLHETKAPVGFAKLTEDIEFTVGEGTYTTSGNIDFNVAGATTTNTTNDAMQVKNKKITIPQTGGMGTVIFTMTGISIMGAAAFAMKRRKEEE